MTNPELWHQVAGTLMGEAGGLGLPGMLACAYAILSMRNTDYFASRLEGEAGLQNALTFFYGWNRRPSEEAQAIASLVVREDVEGIRKMADDVGLLLPPEWLPYCMGQGDVDIHHWRDGDVVVVNDQNGQAIHLYGEWPGEKGK